MQAAQITATIATIKARDTGDNEDPRTELDLHANMVFLGAHAFIFESTNRTCNVQPFDPSLGIVSKKPIADSAVLYKLVNLPQFNSKFQVLLSVKPYLLVLLNFNQY